MALSGRYIGLLVSLFLLFLLPAQWLAFDRNTILAGEYWRLLSAHWTHVGWAHLLLNASGVLVLGILFPGRDRVMVWLGVLLAMALGISMGLLWLQPELSWYRGFSGCLYGLFVYESIRHLRQQPWTAAGVLALVLGKLAIDALGLGGDSSRELIGAQVIDAAHVAGVISGGVLATAIAQFNRLRLPAWGP